MLIENGADVNAKNNYKPKSPLHIASYMGKLETVKLLLIYGADIDIKNKDGATPLHEALYGLHDDREYLKLRKNKYLKDF